VRGERLTTGHRRLGAAGVTLAQGAAASVSAASSATGASGMTLRTFAPPAASDGHDGSGAKRAGVGGCCRRAGALRVACGGEESAKPATTESMAVCVLGALGIVTRMLGNEKPYELRKLFLLSSWKTQCLLKCGSQLATRSTGAITGSLSKKIGYGHPESLGHRH